MKKSSKNTITRKLTEGGAELIYNSKHLGHNKSEIARRLGVTSGLISHWIYGRRRPGLSNASKLQKLYNVKIDLW